MGFVETRGVMSVNGCSIVVREVEVALVLAIGSCIDTGCGDNAVELYTTARSSGELAGSGDAGCSSSSGVGSIARSGLFSLSSCVLSFSSVQPMISNL